MTIRVVLDTNTLVSALLFTPDNWTWLREAWRSDDSTPVVCAETTMELIRVLGYPKFQLDAKDQKPLLAEILPHCETVLSVSARQGLAPCRDPKDQIFLDLAAAARVELLVSGDRDLLAYTHPVPFQIIAPVDLRSRL